MKARDIMSSERLWAVPDDTDCQHAARQMVDHDIGAVPVLDDEGQLTGIVTDRDLACRLVAQGRSPETPVTEIMSKPVHTVHPEADIRDVEVVMEQYKIRRLPVIDENNVMQGWISLADLSRHLSGPFKEHQLHEVIEAVSTPSRSQ